MRENLTYVLDNRGIAESLHVYRNEAKLTVYEVGIFSREILDITTLENMQAPSFKSYLSSSFMGVFLRLWLFVSWPVLISSVHKILEHFGRL